MSIDLIEVAKKVLAEGKGRAELIRRVPGTTIWAARKAIEAAQNVGPGPANLQEIVSDPIMRIAAVRRLKKGTTINELADALGVGPGVVEALITSIEVNGYPVVRSGDEGVCIRVNDTMASVQPKLTLKSQGAGGTFTFGLVADTHLCSRFQRLDVLEFAYDEFARRKITTVLHAGNLVDGESRLNQHDLLVHGIAEQCDYALDHYPQRQGIMTYYIDGDDHEGWWKQREGIEFGRYLMFEAISRGRDDLQYMGYLENDVIVTAPAGQTVIRVMHPGGGSSYAYSYTSQKLVESFSAGEKPAILLVGHFHKADYCVARHVHVVQGGCAQDQSTFMRKKRLEAVVGFWIITVMVDKNGAVSHFVPEFYSFFDRGYYAKRDDIVLKGK